MVIMYRKTCTKCFQAPKCFNANQDFRYTIENLFRKCYQLTVASVYMQLLCDAILIKHALSSFDTETIEDSKMDLNVLMGK